MREERFEGRMLWWTQVQDQHCNEDRENGIGEEAQPFRRGLANHFVACISSGTSVNLSLARVRRQKNHARKLQHTDPQLKDDRGVK
jgi:hypothetical protein